MARSQKSRLSSRRVDNYGPTPPFSTPPGRDNQPCTIIFGHNAEIKKVLIQFSVTAERLIFDPDDARDVARKLLHYADMADGKKAM